MAPHAYPPMFGHTRARETTGGITSRSVSVGYVKWLFEG